MALLFDQLELSGRLKYVYTDRSARDFLADQLVALRVTHVPTEQDLDAEIGFLTSVLPTYAAALGGEYPDGAQWIVTLERAPIERGAVDDDDAAAATNAQATLTEGYARALALNPGLRLESVLVLNAEELVEMYEVHDIAVLSTCEMPIVDQLWSLTAQACGYGVDRLVGTWPRGCAFPNEPHACAGEFFSDIYDAWISGMIKPGDEYVRQETQPQPSGESGLRRVVLGTGHDYAVIVTWLDDGVLHAAINDYGDSSYMGDGIDVGDPIGLLQWLIKDRFGRHEAQFFEYHEGVDNGMTQTGAPQLVTHPAKLWFTTAGKLVQISTHLPGATPAGHDAGLTEYLIDDWQDLLIALIRDRCDGPGAWNQVQEMLQASNVPTEDRWHGYV